MADMRRRGDLGWEYCPIGQQMGSAWSTQRPDEEVQDTAAVLWVPDPEQRKGYREYYVKKPNGDKPAARPLGFRGKGGGG